MIKIFRTSTVPISLNILLKGQLRFLNQFFAVTAVSGDGQDLREVEQREGVRTIPLEMQRKISPLKDLISLIKMYQLLRREKPQIVHSITPKAGLLSMLAAKAAGVPIRMHTFTGLIFPSKTGLMQKLLIMMDRVLCQCATHIYPEGEGVKKDLVKHRITSKPLKIIANGNVNGIDTNYFDTEKISEDEKSELRLALGIRAEDFVFIFIGRLVRDKGINELVKAFSEAELSNAKLLLVGPRDQDDPLEAETYAEMDNNPQIISVGFQQDVRKYLAISHALAFPSYREGFPNVVLQAGAMGLPCIVTDISGSNEIVKNGLNGLIVPVKDVQAFQTAMHRLYSDKSLYDVLKSAARGVILQKYRQQIVWEAQLAEYQSILNNVQANH